LLFCDAKIRNGLIVENLAGVNRISLWINGDFRHKKYIITVLRKGDDTSLNNNKLLSPT